MQIKINIPDNLPQAIVEQQINEFEEKLIRLTATTAVNIKSEKLQAIQQIIKRCESLPVIDERTPDEILGYEQSPNGLWSDD
jgi:hypothetical protein